MKEILELLLKEYPDHPEFSNRFNVQYWINNGLLKPQQYVTNKRREFSENEVELLLLSRDLSFLGWDMDIIIKCINQLRENAKFTEKGFVNAPVLSQFFSSKVFKYPTKNELATKSIIKIIREHVKAFLKSEQYEKDWKYYEKALYEKSDKENTEPNYSLMTRNEMTRKYGVNIEYSLKKALEYEFVFPSGNEFMFSSYDVYIILYMNLFEKEFTDELKNFKKMEIQFYNTFGVWPKYNSRWSYGVELILARFFNNLIFNLDYNGAFINA